MSAVDPLVEQRLDQLESHLREENPVLLDAVQLFRRLDDIGRRIGLLDQSQTFVTRISWWPLISVLGTFSAGKSSFINYYLGHELQRTGNQAVDDRFSVVCFSPTTTPQALPGIALDADPRFPFYRMSQEIEHVSEGEGKRIDAYLQMKTVASEKLKGRILIDSPGFDADAQRTSTLRITDHIIDLADLVLVFFDARHPEPGAMQDTLNHLVASTLKRPDSSKFMFILNQIDTAAREDNPEDVVAAWQRALAEKGLTAGRFYTIYNPDVAQPIEDPALRERFESKRDVDLEEITGRMQAVSIERAYRIVGSLEQTAREIERVAVPTLDKNLSVWRKRVLWSDGIVTAAIVIAVLAWSISQGQWHGLSLQASWWQWLTDSPRNLYIGALIGFLGFVAIHYLNRSWVAKSILKSLKKAVMPGLLGNLTQAFSRSTRPWRSIWATAPAGWSNRTKKKVTSIVSESDQLIQALNDRFTDPSGRRENASNQDVVARESLIE